MKLSKIKLSGKEVLPIVEGGKGIGASSGVTAGHFALNGAVGTLSATNADFYNLDGETIRYIFDAKSTRREKFEQLIKYSIQGAIDQLQIASDIASGKGRIHINVLWEAGGTQQILESVLEKSKNLLHGVTSGAGLPYELAAITSKYGVYYYPIVSSARAFNVLWRRAYSKFKTFLGGVVYEDPWLAGGHNGLSNSESPDVQEDPYPRIVKLRNLLKELKLDHVPIIIAGGVWNLTEWKNYIDNDEVGSVAFQFGTRPLLTQESPISDGWKNLLMTIKAGDVSLNQFSPTGFFSSALRNNFLKELESRSQRQMLVSRKPEGEFVKAIPSGNGVTNFYVKEEDYKRAMSFITAGYDHLLKTPDGTVIFVTKQQALQIKEDQINCMGCLSACRFSNWSQKQGSTGIPVDPRSFCIQKTLQDVAHGGDVQNNLIFAGHQAFRFAKDPMYQGGYIPTIAELIQSIIAGK